MADLGGDQHVGVRAILIGNDTLDGDKCMGHDAHRSFWIMEKPHAIKIDIARNHDIYAEIAGISDWQAGNQTAVNQPASLRVAYRRINRRNAGAGSNGKWQVTYVAKNHGGALVQIHRESGEWDLEIFEARDRQMLMQKLFHPRVCLQAQSRK